MSKRQRQIAIRKWGPGYLLVLPCALLLAVMMLYPVIQTTLFSFSTVKLPTFATIYVGVDNFLKIWSDAETGPLVQRTLVWTIATVALRFVLGFAAALIFNARVRGTICMRILVILPWTIPSVVAANLWRWILQTDAGLLNQTLKSWGFSDLALNWLADPNTAMGAVVVAYSWAGFPFVMLLILSGMQGIPEEHYDAARVDGANAWQLFRHVTIPSLKGLLGVVLILEVVSGINSFDTLMIMTGGGPANTTQIWGLEIYRTGFNEFNLGGASALSVVLLIGMLVLFATYGFVNNRVQSKKGSL